MTLYKSFDSYNGRLYILAKTFDEALKKVRKFLKEQDVEYGGTPKLISLEEVVTKEYIIK